MKRFFSLLLICTLLFSLSGCTSKAAKNVIGRINSLSEITIDSKDELDEVNALYNELDEKDKKHVKNYSVLEEANLRYKQVVCEDINQRILDNKDNTSAGNLDNLLQIQYDYRSLSAEDKEKITNIDLLNKAIEACKREKAKEITEKVLSYANGYTSSAEELLKQNESILSDEQKEECLVEIGRWKAPREAEKYLKNYLKDPNSYTNYEASCTKPALQNDGRYKVMVHLDYGAKNSFNAMIRDKVELYVYYSVNTSLLSITFEETTLTAYYAWQFARG